MTANWATQVASSPKLIGIGVEKPAFTHELIAEGGVFSLYTIDREDRAIVRKFTKPVEVDLEARHRANGFAFHDGADGRARSSTRPWRGSTARYASPSRWETTRCSSARSSTLRLPEGRGHRPCCAWRTRA